jgi:chromosome partitioning protein
MKIINSVNAKGGCGKSTIAMNVAAGLARRGYRTLLVDLDPQAQVTQWLRLGNGIDAEGTIVEAWIRNRPFREVIQASPFENLWFVASSVELEDLGRAITQQEGYESVFAQLLAEESNPPFDFVVVDSPNQISPIMRNAVFATDVFLVPFEGTQAIRSYANFFQLVLDIRPDQSYKILHVLNDVSKQDGLRRYIIDLMHREGLTLARTEVRSCGWLARTPENQGSIFAYRPHSKGAEDMALLVDEVLESCGIATAGPPVRPVLEVTIPSNLDQAEPVTNQTP